MANAERRRFASHNLLRFLRVRQDDLVTARELASFRMGEPSTAFYPPNQIDEGNVIFLESARKKTAPKPKKESEFSIATRRDFRARMRYQLDRYIQLDQRGELTPQMRRFGRKHREEIRQIQDR